MPSVKEDIMDLIKCMQLSSNKYRKKFDKEAMELGRLKLTETSGDLEDSTLLHP